MQLSIDKPSLVKALAHVASVVERRNTIPILGNVLLSAGNNELGRSGDQGRLDIACGAARFSLQTLPADDFPSLSVDDLGHAFSVPAADLKKLIDKTRFAISTEET